MYKLVTIGGHGGLVEGKRGAFFNTLEEYHHYWERIDVICPKVKGRKGVCSTELENVFMHPSPWPKILQPVFIAIELRRIFRSQGIDLIVVQEYPPFYNTLGVIFAGIKNTPVVYEILHIVGYPRAGNFLEKLYFILNFLFLSKVLKGADLVRVMNQEVKDLLIRKRVPAEKIKIIQAIYLDRKIFYPAATEKKFDLVFSARLARNKGIFLLLDALKFAIGQRPKTKLLIIGDGPEREKLIIRAKKLGIEKNITLAGWVKDSQAVADLFSQSKIFIMPSFNEGGPRTLIEAMACGLAVIATRVGLAPEVVKDGENGFLVNWEAEEIARKALILLDNQELLERFSNSNPVDLDKMDRGEAIKNYAEAYHLLIEQWPNK